MNAMASRLTASARKGRPADETARLPASGSVVWRRVDSPGLPVHFFED